MLSTSFLKEFRQGDISETSAVLLKREKWKDAEGREILTEIYAPLAMDFPVLEGREIAESSPEKTPSGYPIFCPKDERKIAVVLGSSVAEAFPVSPVEGKDRQQAWNTIFYFHRDNVVFPSPLFATCPNIKLPLVERKFLLSNIVGFPKVPFSIVKLTLEKDRSLTGIAVLVRKGRQCLLLGNILSRLTGKDPSAKEREYIVPIHVDLWSEEENERRFPVLFVFEDERADFFSRNVSFQVFTYVAHCPWKEVTECLKEISGVIEPKRTMSAGRSKVRIRRIEIARGKLPERVKRKIAEELASAIGKGGKLQGYILIKDGRGKTYQTDPIWSFLIRKVYEGKDFSSYFCTTGRTEPFLLTLGNDDSNPWGLVEKIYRNVPSQFVPIDYGKAREKFRVSETFINAFSFHFI